LQDSNNFVLLLIIIDPNPNVLYNDLNLAHNESDTNIYTRRLIGSKFTHSTLVRKCVGVLVARKALAL